MLFGNLPAIAQDYRSHHDKGTKDRHCKLKNLEGLSIIFKFATPQEFMRSLFVMCRYGQLFVSVAPFLRSLHSYAHLRYQPIVNVADRSFRCDRCVCFVAPFASPDIKGYLRSLQGLWLTASLHCTTLSPLHSLV
ncbi:MAG: hypothetical protein IM580_08220 [Pseudanabaena sp. M090S1SP2A07QC]|uniref:hypothetical protein n=1 Tax=Pseudanabaena mucicola TaxID=71190 RepID=UPI00257718F5|nr:hypothetical protein [Pseudanabaena mucicola]MCA6502583.1 hypothetical protein [Pseudanabaena sp. M090S1SP2A07QC]